MAGSSLTFESVVQLAYSPVNRLAAALCGDAATATSIARRVLERRGVIFTQWKDAVEARRWFLRYTILCCREHQPVSSKNDPLFLAATTADQQAMIVAIRHLPVQQREAFLLHHGEHLDLRQTATSMDCSSAAAGDHLKAAEESLRQIAIGGLGAFIAALPGIMARLTPEMGTITLEIDRAVRKRRRHLWFRRLVLTPIKWLLLTTLIVEAWKWRHALK